MLASLATDPVGAIGDICIESPAACEGESSLLRIAKSASLLSPDGSETMVPVDVVLWNPWIDKSRALADLGEESYPNFICVEPGKL